MTRIPAIVLFLVSASIASTLTMAQDFRVETDIFLGESTTPAVQYRTFFSGDVVYDFRLTAPEEVMILDTARGRIVLMDLQRRIKSEFSTSETLDLCAQFKLHVDESNALLHFACNPQFEVETEEGSKGIKLSSPVLTYRVRGDRPKQPSAVGRYQEYADWSARVSAMRPGGLPPHARIEVNRHIAQKGWLPEEVVRTVTGGPFKSQKLELRTRHMSNWILSETDRKRITRVGDELVTLTGVPFSEYSEVEKVEAGGRRPEAGGK